MLLSGNYRKMMIMYLEPIETGRSMVLRRRIHWDYLEKMGAVGKGFKIWLWICHKNIYGILGSGCVCKMFVESVTAFNQAGPIWRSRSVGQSYQSTFKLDSFTGEYNSDDNFGEDRAIVLLDRKEGESLSVRCPTGA